MIRYTDSLDDIDASMLTGFFEGWKDPPSPDTHAQILRASAHVVLAIDDDAGQVAGFINAVSDGILSAYIPLLEVRPEYRGRGIGGRLVDRMLEKLQHLYMVDLVCDEPMLGFYEARGMTRANAAIVRNWDRQSGSSDPAN